MSLRVGGRGGWLHIKTVYRERSPVTVLTGLDVEQLRRWAHRRYHWATAPVRWPIWLRRRASRPQRRTTGSPSFDQHVAGTHVRRYERQITTTSDKRGGAVGVDRRPLITRCIRRTSRSTKRFFYRADLTRCCHTQHTDCPGTRLVWAPPLLAFRDIRTFLWSPCVIGQTIFLPCDFFLSSFFLT